MDTTRDDAQRELLQKQIAQTTQKRDASTILMRRVEGRIEATDQLLGVSFPAFRKGIDQLREKGEMAKRFEELFGRIPQKKELDAMIEIMDDAVQGMRGVIQEQRGRWQSTIPVLAGKLAAHEESLQEFAAALPKPPPPLALVIEPPSGGGGEPVLPAGVCPVVGCTTQGEHTHDAGGPAVEAAPG